MPPNKSFLRLKEKPLQGIPHGYSLSDNSSILLTNKIGERFEKALLSPFYRRTPIDRPILLVGPFRSGTSLVESIIAEHPDVAHFWYMTNVYYRAPVTGYVGLRLLYALGVLDREKVPALHNPRLLINDLSPDECEWIWSQCSKGLWDEGSTDVSVDASYSDPDFERYLYSVIRRHLWVTRKKRFLNKNPVNCLRLSYVAKLFPDARLVSIVRHPVDTVISHHRTAQHMRSVYAVDPESERIFLDQLHMDTLSTRIKTPTLDRTLALDEEHPMLGIANQWKDMQGAVLDSLDADPGLQARVHQVRYEDLTARPEKTLQRLFDHVELNGEHGERIKQAYAGQLGVSPSRELRDEERAVLPRVWEIVAPVAERLGYERPSSLNEGEA